MIARINVRHADRLRFFYVLNWRVPYSILHQLLLSQVECGTLAFGGHPPFGMEQFSFVLFETTNRADVHWALSCELMLVQPIERNIVTVIDIFWCFLGMVCLAV